MTDDPRDPKGHTSDGRSAAGESPAAESEARAGYLHALDTRLTQIAGKYGTDRIMADVAQISSRARKH